MTSGLDRWIYQNFKTTTFLRFSNPLVNFQSSHFSVLIFLNGSVFIPKCFVFHTFKNGFDFSINKIFMCLFTLLFIQTIYFRLVFFFFLVIFTAHKRAIYILIACSEHLIWTLNADLMLFARPINVTYSLVELNLLLFQTTTKINCVVMHLREFIHIYLNCLSSQFLFLCMIRLVLSNSSIFSCIIRFTLFHGW